MDIKTIIRKKRSRQELTRDEIRYFIGKLSKGEIQESQAAAVLSYIYINGMTEREILELISLKGSTSLSNKMNKFYHVTLDEIEELDLPYIKKRTVNPLVNGKRIKIEE